MQTSPLNILMLAGQFYPDIAGSGLATRSIAEDLAERGFGVTVAVDRASEERLGQLDLPYRVQYVNDYKAFMTGRASFKRATEEVFDIFESASFDVVHVFGYLPMLLISLCRSSIDVPVVFTFWNTPYKLKRSIGFYDRSELDMQLSTNIITMCRYDCMILGSKANYASAVAQGANPAHTRMAYHGIRLHEFDAQLAAAGIVDLSQYVPFLSSGAQDRIIMLPGRVAARKGMLEAIDALAIVNATYPSRLLLTGMAEPHAVFAAEVVRAAEAAGVRDRLLIPECVIERDALAACYLRADVVITPSYYEGLGLTAIEALRAGRPLVAADAPGLDEVVRDGENGLLVPPRDGRALADAILTLLNEPRLAARLAQAGPASVAKFDMKKFVDHLVLLYAELTAPAGTDMRV